MQVQMTMMADLLEEMKTWGLKQDEECFELAMEATVLRTRLGQCGPQPADTILRRMKGDADAAAAAEALQPCGVGRAGAAAPQ